MQLMMPVPDVYLLMKGHLRHQEKTAITIQVQHRLLQIREDTHREEHLRHQVLTEV